MAPQVIFPSFSFLPEPHHGGRRRDPGLHCLHQRSAAETPTVWWGWRETRNPQGDEEDIAGLRKRRFRPYLPSIMMGNVQSLVNKMDELTSLTRSKSVFREGSVMCFTETWLHDNVPDTIVSLAGFQLVRADSSCKESGKKKGGGVAIYALLPQQQTLGD